MTNMNPAAAYVAYASTVSAALTDRNPDLTDVAQARRRAETITAARATLRAAIPATPEASGARQALLAARAPKTADDVALFAREREKVAALVAAGHPIAEIVGEASELRVAALADDLEVSRALDSFEAAGLEDALVARLIDLGAVDAVEAEAEHSRSLTASAWSGILGAAADGQDIDVADWNQVFQSDHDGYAVTLGAGVVFDSQAVNRAATPPQA